jgi:hypothetical protein
MGRAFGFSKPHSSGSPFGHGPAATHEASHDRPAAIRQAGEPHAADTLVFLGLLYIALTGPMSAVMILAMAAR